MKPKPIFLIFAVFFGCEPNLPKGTVHNESDSASESPTNTDSAGEPSDETQPPTDPVEPDTGTETDSGFSNDTNAPLEERITCQVQTNFIEPIDFEFFQMGAQINASVQLDSLSDYTGYTIRWEDSVESEIFTAAVDETGMGSYSGLDFTQNKGLQRIYARLITPDGICDTRIEKPVTVCGQYFLEDFTVQPSDWVTHGDAYWDPSGWIEMTGISQGKKGAVYNTQDTISSGVTSIRFTLQTGGGLNSGADGFAFTIIDIGNPQDLVTWLEQARSGGGLAYGFGGVYGNWVGDALTVEIDTWHNTYNGTNEFHTDPTTASHIALTKNADPSNHMIWFETPTVEDYQPHPIRVDILNGAVRVFYDGSEVINQAVSVNFKGGQMFFSGSTGWATNYHVFDGLEILHECQ